jgi:hypothetical protein
MAWAPSALAGLKNARNLVPALLWPGVTPCPGKSLADQAAITRYRSLNAFQRPWRLVHAALDRSMFTTPEIFMQMIKTVARLPPMRWFRQRDVGGTLVQDVFLVGPDGRPVIARYSMEKQPDGSWRINGCALTQAPDQNV